jgi:hypothetical protein
MRRRRVRCRLALGDLRFVRLLAVEDRGDVGDGARRRDERGANFERRVGSGGSGVFWRGGGGNASGLLLLFTKDTGAHDRAAACLSRLLQFGADRATRIADLTAHAGAQLLHVRLPARFDNLLVRSSARGWRGSDDCKGGAEGRREAATRVEPVGHALFPAQGQRDTCHRRLSLDRQGIANKVENWRMANK